MKMFAIVKNNHFNFKEEFKKNSLSEQTSLFFNFLFQFARIIIIAKIVICIGVYIAQKFFGLIPDFKYLLW